MKSKIQNSIFSIEYENIRFKLNIQTKNFSEKYENDELYEVAVSEKTLSFTYSIYLLAYPLSNMT